MNTLRLLLTTLLLAIAIHAASRQPGTDKRTVSNRLYTVSIPADWIPFPPGAGDGITPDERTTRQEPRIRIFTIHWHSPLDGNTPTDGYDFVVQSFRREDGQDIPLSEMARLIKLNSQPSAEVKNVTQTPLEGKPGQERYLVEREGTVLSPAGSNMRQERIYYLIQTTGKTAHLMQIYVTESFCQQHPEAEQAIEEVMDSFKTPVPVPSSR